MNGESKPSDIRARLEAMRLPDEVITPLEPSRLAAGTWWNPDRDGKWPDALRAGVLEPRRGYRHRPENLALAALLTTCTASAVCELGTGTGSLAVIAYHMLNKPRVAAVELQAPMVRRAARTFEAHRMPADALILGDLRTSEVLDKARNVLTGRADLIVANPPYFPSGWGRTSRSESTQASTHALNGDVRAFTRSAAALIAPEGMALFVFDAQRLVDLLSAAGEAGLGVQRLLWIPDQRPGKEHQPFRVWVELRLNGGARVHKLA